MNNRSILYVIIALVIIGGIALLARNKPNSYNTVSPTPPILTTPPSSPGTTGATEMANVDFIDVTVNSGLSKGVSATARGNFPNPCTQLGDISQERSGNTFTVTLPIKKTDSICAQVLQPFKATFDLINTENLAPGDYTIIVNNVQKAFMIAANTGAKNSLTMKDQPAGTTVTVPSVTLSEKGFVVIHEVNKDGDPAKVIGISDLLQPGTYTNVKITLDRSSTKGEKLIVMTHKDNGDGVFSEAKDPEFMQGSDPVRKTFSIK